MKTPLPQVSFSLDKQALQVVSPAIDQMEFSAVNNTALNVILHDLSGKVCQKIRHRNEAPRSKNQFTFSMAECTAIVLLIQENKVEDPLSMVYLNELVETITKSINQKLK